MKVSKSKLNCWYVYEAGDQYTVNEDHTFKAIWKAVKPDDKKDDTESDALDKKDDKRPPPKTGDDNGINMILWLGLMCASAAVLVKAWKRS